MSGRYLLPFNQTQSGKPIVDQDRRGQWVINEDAKGEEPRTIQPKQDRSILVLGETGSGKTEAITLLVYQFAVGGDDPFIVFDYKGDYRAFFERYGRGEDLLTISLEGSDEIWNLFAEVDRVEEFDEIGRQLFMEEERASSNSFFPRAAKDVFVATCKYLYERDDIDPSNEYLVRFIDQGPKALYGYLTDEVARANGLSGAAVNIDVKGASKQALGVHGHLQTVVSEMFRGDFRSDGDFSVSGYMKNPRGRTLLLDFPLDRGETVKPVYRFFIDWAIRDALNDDRDDAYFVLDEFQTIPGLEKIERLVNAGRAQGAYSVLGLQSVSQLYSTYGEEQASSILSGLAQEILLRSGDRRTTDYVRSRLGQEFVTREVRDDDGRLVRDAQGNVIENPDNTTEIKREEYPVSERTLQQFRPGEGFVVTQTGRSHGRLMMLEPIVALDRLSGIHQMLLQ